MSYDQDYADMRKAFEDDPGACLEKMLQRIENKLNTNKMTCREKFNLWNKNGRYAFFKRGIFGDHWARTYVLNDTLRSLFKLYCKVFGHAKPFLTEEGDEFCPRCYSTINK